MTHVAAQPFQEVEKVSITIVTDNYTDGLRPDTAVGKRYRAGGCTSIHAEHGLSYFIRASTSTGTCTFMFDYGVDGRGVLNNMRLLDVELNRIDALGLSHGHFDHWGALVEILKEHHPTMPGNIPLYVGEEAFAHRYALSPQNELRDLGQLDRVAIEGLGVRIVEIDETTEVIPGAYLTGPIERTTEYEQVPPLFFVDRQENREQDQFRGEQAVAFLVKGRGLVVLSGCAHVGIVNTVRHARKVTGVTRLHAVVGGFHLVNAPTERIEATVADMKAMAPDYIVPTHCTGFEAITRFREEMPEQFILNTAGTTYVFGK